MPRYLSFVATDFKVLMYLKLRHGTVQQIQHGSFTATHQPEKDIESIHAKSAFSDKIKASYT